MLAAFAGVEEVAAQLDGSIAETAAMIERAERRRAEAAGRREMATELQEALRTVGAHSLGEGYNVVRETLQLPRIAASVREGRRRRQAALESAHAAQMRALASEPPAVVAAAREGHAVAAREARLRDEMANPNPNPNPSPNPNPDPNPNPNPNPHPKRIPNPNTRPASCGGGTSVTTSVAACSRRACSGW